MVEASKREKHWSDNEKIAAGILLSVLAVFVVLLGLVLYEPPTGPGLCGAFVAEPCPGREDLNFTTSSMNSPTNITIQVWNVGTVSLSFVSYYVKDSYGQTYANPSWSGPSVYPNARATFNVLIDGKAFTFQSSSYYTIILVTSRSTQFTFTVQA